MKKFIALLSLTLFSFASLYSQQTELSSTPSGNFKKMELSNSVNKISTEDKLEINLNPTASSKSGGLAMLLSLVLPGAGHLYLDRMDVGKYFVGGEALSWLGIAGLNIYGSSIRDDARIYASQHAGLERTGKDENDDFWTSVGKFKSIYDYNNEQLATGEYDKVYDVNTHYWNWDNTDNRDRFEGERRESERMFNTTILFTTGLVINRVASAISALILSRGPNTTSGGIKIGSELTKDYKNKIDGFKLNFTKNF